MTGLRTLFYKEVLRFLKVSVQTVLAPVVTVLLYLLIFRQVLEGHVEVYGSVSYTAFMVPGLVMMAMLQNAFSNSSSSLIQSKYTGNIIFILLPPITYWEFFLAFTGASVVRGIVVGLGVWACTLVFMLAMPAHGLWVLAFTLLGCAFLGALGLAAAIWSESYDQLSALQNFVVVPLTFLSGVFYSIHSLPPFWQAVSRLNPFFYLVDGFRYGFLGVSDVSPWASLGVVGGGVLAVSLGTLFLLKTGYKLRH
jgi:ABC-2 type transport system permease protein